VPRPNGYLLSAIRTINAYTHYRLKIHCANNRDIGYKKVKRKKLEVNGKEIVQVLK
jgi:hypothetical protein